LLPNNEEQRYTMRAFAVKMPLHRVRHDFSGTQSTAGATPTAVTVYAHSRCAHSGAPVEDADGLGADR
jgi:hypothetical protein